MMSICNALSQLLGPAGFGIGTDERSVTFSLEVDGAEVEWTLGAFLHSRLHSSALSAVDNSDAAQHPATESVSQNDLRPSISTDVYRPTGPTETTGAANDMAVISGWLPALSICVLAVGLWRYSKRKRTASFAAARGMKAMTMP